MWNKWRIIEFVIISRNEVKNTIAFKTCEPEGRCPPLSESEESKVVM